MQFLTENRQFSPKFNEFSVKNAYFNWKPAYLTEFNEISRENCSFIPKTGNFDTFFTINLLKIVVFNRKTAIFDRFSTSSLLKSAVLNRNPAILTEFEREIRSFQGEIINGEK